MRIGLFGGSFNPVHLDHVRMAELIKNKLQLDKVLFILNATPPHKDTVRLSYEHRRAMLALAIENQADFEISDIEKDTAVNHYTYDTLSRLREYYGNDEGLFFIMGEDSLLYLDEWYRGLELIEFANLVVTNRVGYEHSQIKPSIKAFIEKYAINCDLADKSQLAVALTSPCGTCFLLNLPLHPVSSTVIRQKINADTNSDIAAMLDKKVLNYIKKHHLYEQ
ncbi:MAG: nicotinate (nicotinamide) nucleotide adenylyltransferase [Succinivibrio sp.]|nr:nicotinate (nicotinamide) nucleotide adenylyltransferase [Succinivibrio sp.]